MRIENQMLKRSLMALGASGRHQRSEISEVVDLQVAQKSDPMCVDSPAGQTPPRARKRSCNTETEKSRNESAQLIDLCTPPRGQDTILPPGTCAELSWLQAESTKNTPSGTMSHTEAPLSFYAAKTTNDQTRRESPGTSVSGNALHSNLASTTCETVMLADALIETDFVIRVPEATHCVAIQTDVEVIDLDSSISIRPSQDTSTQIARVQVNTEYGET